MILLSAAIILKMNLERREKIKGKKKDKRQEERKREKEGKNTRKVGDTRLCKLFAFLPLVGQN